jgi:hypothetical protein
LTYGLNVVADLLRDQLSDVLDEGVLDADLVAVYAGCIVSMALFGSADMSISGTYSWEK